MIDLRGEPRVEPFRMGNGERGCLLLHGLTGSPDEVHPLGTFLGARGWTVSGPCLPGHGTVVEDLARTGWRDWYGAVTGAWDELGRSTALRTVAGLSMGSLLALHLAVERPDEVAAVVALAPALRLRNQSTADHARWLAHFPFLPRRFAFVPKRGSGRNTLHYDQVPVRALASMLELQDIVRSELRAVRAPCFVLAGARDETIHPTAAAEVEAGVGSSVVRSALYPESGHILTEDRDADRVLADVADFLDGQSVSASA